MKRNMDFKILVAGDSSEWLSIAVIALKNEDYNVFSAKNGSDCMELLYMENPDMVLLDVMLPDVSGIELCRRIKNDPAYSSVFIILLSESTASSDDVSEGLEEGADGYISRPGGNRELLERVKSACRIISVLKTNNCARILLQTSIDSPEDINIAALDKEYNYLALNKCHRDNMLKTYGVDVKPGMNLLECISNEEDILKLKVNYDKALSGIHHRTVEEFGDLNRIYYEITYNPIYNELNEIIGVTSFAYNVTEKVNIEKSLKRSEEKFKKIFITNPDSININRIDNGMFVSVNEGFTKITGYSEEDIFGKTSVDLNIWTDPTDREKLISGFKSEGNIVTMNGTFKRKDGSVRNGTLTASKIYFDGVPHILCITRDDTERKLAEMALEERTNELQKELEERKIAEKELKESHKQLEISRLKTMNLLEEIRTEMNQRQEAEELISKRSEELFLSEEKFKNVFEFASVGKSMTSLGW